MKQFLDLIDVIEKLLSPIGCPWDREQTLMSMRSSLLEEAYEVIDAIEKGDPLEIREELGDLLFNVIFLCRLAEKEKVTNLSEVNTAINEKLIRRHPHVFGETKNLKTDEVLVQWNEIKEVEKNKKTPNSVLEQIPKGLPILLRANKMFQILKKQHHLPKSLLNQKIFEDEKSLGDFLLQVMLLADEKKLNAEVALNVALNKLGQEFQMINQLKDIEK